MYEIKLTVADVFSKKLDLSRFSQCRCIKAPVVTKRDWYYQRIEHDKFENKDKFIISEDKKGKKAWMTDTVTFCFEI